jgi:hypothetical protein
VVSFKQVVLATGAESDKRLGIPGEERKVSLLEWVLLEWGSLWYSA